MASSSSALLPPPAIAAPQIRNPNCGKNITNSSLLDRGIGLGFLPNRTIIHPKKPSLRIRAVQTDRRPGHPPGGGGREEDDPIQRFLKRDYKWGFVSDIESFSIPKGLSEDTVRSISALKGEPEWMLRFRLDALRRFLSLREPRWSDNRYTPIDFQSICYYSEPKRKPKLHSLDEADPELLATFDRLGIPLNEQKRLTNVAVDAVLDSTSIATTHREALAEKGVIFCSISEAIREYPDLVRRYLGRVVPPGDNFYAALNSAVFSDGSFCYIPKDTVSPMEISTYFRINDRETGQFERTLIIADERSYVSYLEGCTAPAYDRNQLHAAVVELYCAEGAEIKYSTVQNWYAGDEEGNGGIYNFVTKRGLCDGNRSKISWTQVETGSAITWKYPSVVLKGDDTVGEFFQSVSTALWRTRSPDGREALPAATSAGTADAADPAPDKPPEPVKIPDEDLKKPAGAPCPASEEPHPQSSPTKKPTHIKRVSSVGLQIDSILQRRTGKLKDLYSLGRRLGQGQFGTTYLCVEKATGKEYACKSISKRKLVTEEDVEDVRREIQIMHHLAGHPNVISIVGAYEDAVAVHLVMELCAGGELFDRIIQRGHYSEKAAAGLARVIVGVVEACHSLGVMHRDLKPENFLFVNQKEESPLKTIDFGLSIFFKPGDTFTDVVGSPYYVASEVLLKHYGPEADVWSAGVIIYILLCGVPPFWDESEQGIFEQVLKGDLDFSLDPWPSISESAKDLVRRMLVRDPKRRSTAHEVLCHPWVQVDGVAPDKPLDSAVLTRLKQFSAMNKLKKMALRVIAESMSEEEIAGLKEMFKMIDTDNSGQITYEELKVGLQRVGANLKDSEISALMEAADIDNSGTIDYGEFIAATLHLNKVERDDNLFAAFSYFDKDGSGYITQDELQKACEEFGIEDARLDEMIREIDQDNDGRIDYNEFVEMMHKGNAGFGKKGQQNNLSFGLMEALKLG